MNSLVDYAASGSVPGGDVAYLISRLESAEAGSRELDAAIFRAFGEPLPTEFADHGIRLTWQDDGKATMPLGDLQVAYTPPAYTTSLDAALALCERVLGEAFALDMLWSVLELHEAEGLSIKGIPCALCSAALASVRARLPPAHRPCVVVPLTGNGQ